MLDRGPDADRVADAEPEPTAASVPVSTPPPLPPRAREPDDEADPTSDRDADPDGTSNWDRDRSPRCGGIDAAVAHGTPAWPAVANERLLRWLLESVVICDVSLERFLTASRAALLDLVETAPGSIDGSQLGFVCALARQCFNNEYVYATTERESAGVAKIRGAGAGMTPAQVQLALAIRAHGDAAGPTVTELADTLLLRHHSVVGLIDRAEHAGLVQRARDAEHQSRVRVRLTREGADRLRRLSALHLQWLAEHGPEIGDTWNAFGARRAR